MIQFNPQSKNKSCQVWLLPGHEELEAEEGVFEL